MPIRLPDNLASLRAYIPGRPMDEVRQEFGLTDVVKLASNENPLGPSPLAISAISEWSKSASLYPDAGCVDLKEALARNTGLPSEQLAIGNGSDELIHLLSALLLRPGDSVVMADPGFSRYEAEATIAGAETRKVAVDEQARHDLTSMASATDSTTRIVWIANPNNPTGTIVRHNELTRFIENISDDVAIVLDEAYFEFAADAEYPNCTQFIGTFPNVIGLRTFSKTYGLAGLRVGYAIASVDIVQAIEKVRPSFNVNSLAQRAAIAALGDPEHLQATITLNSQGVSRLTQFLISKKCKVAESFGNFVWCDVGCPSDPISEALLRRGIIVRPGSVFGCPNHLRISIGTHQEMDRFEAAFSEVFETTAVV